MTSSNHDSLRALIVDDEPPAQRRMQRLLEDTGRVTVSAVAGSVTQALTLVGEDDIDVAFLDIQMPGSDGFQYVEKVPFDVSVVFVTAYSRFALRAFEVAALDYLLKPVEPDRLVATLDRVERAVRQRRCPQTPDVSGSATTASQRSELICLQLSGGARFVSEVDILCILACDDYSQVILKDGSAELVSVSMRTWEASLPRERFPRVHRSAIAAVSHIRRIDRFKGRWQAWLNGLCDPIPVNRDAARRLRAGLPV